MHNWTSWLDDYGFGKCPDIKKCNVFPDGKPFPQSSDRRRRNYVYVWHTMGKNMEIQIPHGYLTATLATVFHLSPLIPPGQYYETCDGSSSSVTLNTTNFPLGAEVMEVMVYRKSEYRKYSPLTTDNTVFYVTGEDNNRASCTFVCFSRADSNEILMLALSQIRSPWLCSSPRRVPPTTHTTFSFVVWMWSSESSSTTPVAT